MSIKYKTLIYGLIIMLLLCLSLIILPPTLLGDVKRYEVRPEITLPEYKSDIARIVDAYEHLMNNYINLTESSLIDARIQLSDIHRKLDSMDRKLFELSVQLEAIQDKLGIDASNKPQPKLDDPAPLSPAEQ